MVNFAENVGKQNKTIVLSYVHGALGLMDLMGNASEPLDGLMEGQHRLGNDGVKEVGCLIWALSVDVTGGVVFSCGLVSVDTGQERSELGDPGDELENTDEVVLGKHNSWFGATFQHHIKWDNLSPS